MISRTTDLSGDRVATKGDEDREVGVLQLEAVHVRHQACNHVQGLLGDSGRIKDRLGWVVGIEVGGNNDYFMSQPSPSIHCIKNV